jgi:hypothetical protein
LASFLPEIRAPEFLAEIDSFELDDAAHLVKARAHPLADPVA